MSNKIRWGLIGGGRTSQIGTSHRAAASLDGKFSFTAAALDASPTAGKKFAVELGISKSRAYGTWQEMLSAEKKLPPSQRVELVTIATPNDSHFEIARAFLLAGINVLCEKPMTTTLAQAKALVKIAKQSKKICAVNYGYCGYPLVRQMKAMIANGELGSIRIVSAIFATGFMANLKDAKSSRVRWRYDPKQAGISAITGDCGTHALNMACYITGQNITKVSSDFAFPIKQTGLESDNFSAFRLGKNIVGRFWTSGLAIGRPHGLTMEVFGEKGGLRWQQEQPNQLLWTPINNKTQIYERGDLYLDKAALRGCRTTSGHPEGIIPAFANIYLDLFELIRAGKPSKYALQYPTVEQGCHSIEIIEAMVRSAKQNGKWISLPSKKVF